MRNTRFAQSLITLLASVCLLIPLRLSGQTRDSLDIQIGQMLLIGFPGASVDTLVLREVQAGRVGSIILFEKNVPNVGRAFAALKRIIWTYQKAAPIPLLVSIDQEGGRVNRLKEKYGFTRSISAQAMGRSSSLDSVRFYAEATAATLAGLGFNLNLAPVVDLGVNKENTVIYKVGRAFSANPDSVALLAAEFIKPHRRFGVATTLKHFPGHGSSLADTHLGVADVTKTWTAAELIPYQKLISWHSVDAIMTAHIVNKNLDPRGYPGTLSSRIIDSLLRKQLQFNGVVFSDDMQMQAVAKEYGLDEAIRLSINAGVDILCFSNNLQGSEQRTVDKVHSIIRKMVESGEIKRERIDEAYRRVMQLKKATTLPRVEYLQMTLDSTRNELDRLSKVIAEQKKAESVATGKEKKKKKDKKEKQPKKTNKSQ